MNLVVSVDNYNGVLAVTSNEIAEKLGVLHKDLLEKIDVYIQRFKKFSSAELSALFYQPSKYKAKNGVIHYARDYNKKCFKIYISK